MSEKNNKNILYCSFCGKSQHEVRKLIAGPTVFICDECVELCMDIIKEENKSSFIKHQDGVPTPKEICTILDEYVFLAGPHDYGFMNYQSSSFGEYNPLFLSKLYNELSKLYSDEEFVNNFQYLYDSQLKRYLRTYYISYSYAANNEKYIFEYSPNFDEFSTKMDRKGYNWYETNTCSKFWVRRSIDGTSNYFFKLLSLTLEIFDTNFVHENNVKENTKEILVKVGALPESDCFAGVGANYRGNVNTYISPKTGKVETCENWDSKNIPFGKDAGGGKVKHEGKGLGHSDYRMGGKYHQLVKKNY